MVRSDAVKVDIDLQLLRVLVEELDGAGVDVLLQIEAEGLGITQELGRMLIQGHQQTALALLLRPSSSSCTPRTVLPAPERPTTIVVEPSKRPPRAAYRAARHR